MALAAPPPVETPDVRHPWHTWSQAAYGATTNHKWWRTEAEATAECEKVNPRRIPHDHWQTRKEYVA